MRRAGKGEAARADFRKKQESGIRKAKFKEIEEKARILANNIVAEVASGVIKRGNGKSAIEAAKEYIRNNFAKTYSTEIGIAEIDERAIQDSFSHSIYQNKLDAIQALPDVLTNGVYLGSSMDKDGKPIENHYFAAKVKIGNEEKIVFVRTRKTIGRANRFYVHEVFTEEEIKKLGEQQTGATSPNSDRLHRNASELYRTIIAKVLNFKPQNENSSRFSIFGEEGVRRMENAVQLLENLSTAKQMTADGKDAKAIKLATGWELGGDGKWRMEMPDAVFTTRAKLPDGAEYDRTLWDVVNTTNGKLSEYVVADEIFEAYPELKDYHFQIVQMPPEVGGSFNSDTKTIYINQLGLTAALKMVDDAQARLSDKTLTAAERKSAQHDVYLWTEQIFSQIDETLVHEVQHAIQHIEGFATGSNVRHFIDNPEYDPKRLEKVTYYREKLEKAQKNLEKHPDLKKMADRYVELEDVLFSDDNVQVDEAAIDAEMDQIKAHFESLGKRELLMDYITGRDNYKMAKYAAEKHKLDPEEAYRRTAGEVEARNVQRRRNYTMEERLNSLLSETQDVAEKDKIYLNGLVRGGSEMADKKQIKASYLQNSGSLARGSNLGPNNIPEAAARQYLESNIHGIDEKFKEKLLRIFDNILRNKIPEGCSRVVVPDNFASSMISVGFHRDNSGSVYKTINNRTVRISKHSTTAKSFLRYKEENNTIISIVIENKAHAKKFVQDDKVNLIEYVFAAHELSKNDLAIIVHDIAQFYATGTYTDNVGAKYIHFSGGMKDAEYLASVERGDMETAQRMVEEAARAKGYSADDDWRLGHRAPNSRLVAEDPDGSTQRITDWKKVVPEDYFDHPDWYTSSPEERESFFALKRALDLYEQRKAEGKGREKYVGLRVYRAVDKTVNSKESEFRNGDWVTPSKTYAEMEGEGNPDGSRIITHWVLLEHLYWNGDSIAELGYDDGKNYAYADTKNNRKLLDPVTYDDDGNVIPLSKRFNKRSDDVRFSVAPDEELEQTVGQLVVWLTGKGNKGYFYDITDIKYDRKAGKPLIRETPTGALPEEEGQLRTHLPVGSNLPSSAENASGEKKNARFLPRVCAFALCTVVKRYLINRY